MIIKKQNKTNVKEYGDVDKKKAKISEEDTALVLSLLSDNLYSNPIGSYIREIASNASDANRDNDELSPVIIRFYEEDYVHFLSFKDKGKGMNPSQIDKFMTYFASNKRNSNRDKGGWGIGGKSPLSSVDTFQLNTVSEGIYYQYLIQGDIDATTYELVFERKAKENEVGTEVIVEVANSDIEKVNYELKRQLLYFEGVYVKNEIKLYNNDYKLYKEEDFSYRADIDLFDGKMHINLDEVAYPIDWELLEMEPVYLPVALNFKTGELGVTLSREEINYKQDEITLIKDKATAVARKMYELYRQQIQTSNIETFINYLHTKRRPKLIYKGTQINVSNIPVEMVFKLDEDTYINPKDLKNPYSTGFSTSLLFGMYNTHKIRARSRGRGYSYNEHKIISTVQDLITVKILYTKGNSKYDNLYLKEYQKEYLRKTKPSKEFIYKLAELLNLVIISENYPYFKTLKLGASKKIFKFIKLVDEYVESRNKISTKGIAPDYYIEEKKKEEEKKKKRKKTGITYYKLDGSMDKIDLDLLCKCKNILFLLKEDTDENRLAYTSLFKCLPHYVKQNNILLILTQTNIDKLIRHSVKTKDFNVRPASYIFNYPNLKRTFRRIKVKKQLEEFNYSTLYRLGRHYNNIYRELNSSLRGINNTVSGSVKDYYYNELYQVEINLYDYFKVQIESKIQTTPLLYEHNLKELKQIYKKVEILEYVNLEKTPKKEINKFLRLTKDIKIIKELI